MLQAQAAYKEQQVDEKEDQEQLIMNDLPQVYYIARRIHERLPQQVPLEDLVHAGVIGLIEAVRSYDPSKGAPLKSYAKFRIRGAILVRSKRQFRNCQSNWNGNQRKRKLPRNWAFRSTNFLT
jgi:RNA polymerase sigma factor for flagellar operon FliA